MMRPLRLIARPIAAFASSFAQLLAGIGVREVRRAYPAPPMPWLHGYWIVKAEPSIGRKRRARRARGRRQRTQEPA